MIPNKFDFADAIWKMVPIDIPAFLHELANLIAAKAKQPDVDMLPERRELVKALQILIPYRIRNFGYSGYSESTDLRYELILEAYGQIVTFKFVPPDDQPHSLGDKKRWMDYLETTKKRGPIAPPSSVTINVMPNDKQPMPVDRYALGFLGKAVKREFVHLDVNVVEYVWDEWDASSPGVGKILWVREDIHKMVVGDNKNYLVHSDFWKLTAKDSFTLDLARAAIQKKFEEYWANPDSIKPVREENKPLTWEEKT